MDLVFVIVPMLDLHGRFRSFLKSSNIIVMRIPTGQAITCTIFISLLLWGTAFCQEKGVEQAEPAAADQSKALPILGTVPSFQLTDQTGQPSGTRQLKGHVWVANFIFTRCESSCPEQTAKLAEMRKAVDAELPSNDIRLVSITVDPKFDTPEILLAYAKKNGADVGTWKFLTGAREDLWNLSKKGFKLPVGEEGPPEMPILHSSKLILVDPYLRIRGYYDSLAEEDVKRLKADALKLQHARIVYPANALEPHWLGPRQQAQLDSFKDATVFHDFSFVDQIEESEILFRHKVVDDAGKVYKSVHYDHGNGIAVADVDGDGLLDVYFTTQIGGNELWRNLGGGRFENITGDSGLALADRVGVTASFADIDNDGDPDLYATTVRGGNALFENDGKGSFRDVTAASGLAYNGHSSSAVFFDYDRDGLLDLFLTNVGTYTTDELATNARQPFRGDDETAYKYYVGVKDGFAGHLKPERSEQSLLFKNLGGNKFQDVSEKTGLVDMSWTGAAAPMDRNGDGWTDLYVLNMQGPDVYYENMGGKRFEDKTSEFFPRTPWGSMGIQTLDFDNDGDMDIYITDMHSDMSEEVGPEDEKLKSKMRWPQSFLRTTGKESIWGNAFFRNRGDGTYEEVSDEIGAENYWPWGLSVGDLNADGFEDAFVASSMNYPLRYGVNSVLLNDKGSGFVDSEFVLGIEPRRPDRMATPWFELDLGGEDRNHSLQKVASGKIVVWSAAGTRASALFDLDNDGDLDVLTNEFNTGPLVLISDLAARNPKLHFAKIRLVGVKSNRDGLGAVVRVHSASGVQTKVMDGQSGYLSQSVTPLYFGFGEDAELTRIEVEWPSGLKQTLGGPLKMNSTIVIKEEAAAAEPE